MGLLLASTGTTVVYYAGIDVSLEASSVCVVDASGKVIRETKVLSEPENLIGWFKELRLELTRIGLEAVPLSQWLYAAMKKERLDVTSSHASYRTSDSATLKCLATIAIFASRETSPS